MNPMRICGIVMLLMLAVVITVVTVGGIVPESDVTLQVTPEGSREIVLEYGQAYEEPGVRAVMIAKGKNPVELEVETEGAVDTDRVGNYQIRYVTRYKGRIGTAYRNVRVTDTEAPVITLVSDPNKYTLPNQLYEEEGFSAIDGYDGDLTAAVSRTQTAEAVIYTVEDSSGNKTVVTRPVVYNDPTPPELTLNGKTNMIISVGDAYYEPGYVATDNCDGDITQLVKVSGNVNCYVPGNYTLTYTATDGYGNSTSASRTVFVKERSVGQVNDPSSAEKIIYLTFDDGPGPETERLLDVLKKYNVQATFFVVNTSYISTIQRAAQEGHTIAMHTMTHQFKEVYASEEAFFADLYGMQAVIESYTGTAPMLMRFPGGSSNTISKFNKGIMTRLTQQVTEKGFVYFDWNVDSKDAGGATTAQEVYLNVTYSVSNKTESVVLMHDIKSYTVDAIESIIIWALQNGYTFLPLTVTGPTCHHPVLN